MQPNVDESSRAVQQVHKVFLSYAASDESIAKAIIRELNSNSFEVLSLDQVSPGTDLFEEVQRLLRESDAFIVLLSKSSSASAWVISEIGSAVARSVHEDLLILPVLLETPAEVPAFLRQYAWVDISGHRGLEPLVKALQRGGASPPPGFDADRKLEALENASLVLRAEFNERSLVLLERDIRFRRNALVAALVTTTAIGIIAVSFVVASATHNQLGTSLLQATAVFVAALFGYFVRARYTPPRSRQDGDRD